ncbi:MAG: galactose mutarotase [Dysgonamonadaceae bacterium]|jgi:aldose 1-epimerase|nr:galactose mutarotase [Dysgonamonadaceae bacterium]
MKKVLFAVLVFSCLFVSCGKKELVLPDTESGLSPASFKFITDKGDTTHLYVLKNANGMEVCITNIGARIVSMLVPDKNGGKQNVVVGYDSIQPYMQLNDYYGATIGRYANRIAGGTFELYRVTYRLRQNEGKNTLHGGPRGFSTQYFTINQTGTQELVADYVSKDGEEGFPGNLNLSVTFTLTDDNALHLTYRATSYPSTIINVTNHSFFNLSGADAPAITDHSLFIDASAYTEVDAALLPTGKILKVKGTGFDFSEPRTIDVEKVYDLNYVLNHPGDSEVLAAKAVSGTTGIRMEVYTTEPGIQLFTGDKNPSFCLETQHFPDSPHHLEFPSTALHQDSVFNSKTIYRFGIE